MENMVYVLYPPRGPAHTCAGPREVRNLLRIHGGVAWISLTRPEEHQVRDLAEIFHLPQLAVDDTLKGGQRPKVEDYGEIRFLVLRSATPAGDLADSYVFEGKDFVICLHHDEAGAGLDRRVAEEPEFHHDPDEITYLLLDAVVDTYEPVVERIGEEIDHAEDDVFSGTGGVAQRLHEHLREILRHQRAVHALAGIAEQLLGRAPQHLRGAFRDIHDHTLRESARIDSYREVLSSAMQVHIALVGQQQNAEMARMSEAAFAQGEQSKKVASWAAILFTPTVIAGIYGMNFHHMPELALRYGYPGALAAMLAAVVCLYVVFKRQGWL